MLPTLATPALAATPAKRTQEPDSYKYDLGAAIGMSGYLGDCNESDMFRRPGLAGNIAARYLMDNYQVAFRATLAFASLQGNSSDFANWLPGSTPYTFSSTIYDLSARVEYNFFPYGIGETYKHLKPWTPYIAAGIGFCLASTPSITAAASFPLAVGFKYKPAPRWNLNIEFCAAKTSSDHLDSSSIADLQGIKSSLLKNTDWHTALLLGFSYEFGARCSTCHYVD